MNQDRLRAMLRREREAYYVNLHCSPDGAVNAEARAAMVAWCSQVISFCNLEQVTVEIAMNFCDRYCMVEPSVLEDRARYQLCAMTSLYTAAKIHATEAMDPALVSKLSRGTYSVETIEAQEVIILQALEWRMNPVTSTEYVEILLDWLLPPTSDPQQAAICHELCTVQCSWAVQHMPNIPPSVVAWSAISNAFELSSQRKHAMWVGYSIANILQIDEASDLAMHCRNEILTSVCVEPTQVSPQVEPPQEKMRGVQRQVSPRSLMLR